MNPNSPYPKPVPRYYMPNQPAEGFIAERQPPPYYSSAEPQYPPYRAGAEGPPAAYPQPYYTGIGGNPAPAMYRQPEVIVTSVPVIATVVSAAHFGATPTRTTCPSCQQQIVTNISPVPGLLTWLLFGGLLLFGCWLGCCLIPFCVDSLQDVRHTCPSCNHEIGRFKRL
ncbi:lipopolysaccharide-induced tumor necrosis factor-alpha factor homolog [Ambystoma mexicanum]|uniref:lipopolysaccharide-induced tumor necrosis factor-alpha factor homolog n=1 Tax=Ambystoma mexicanum TaxID=8296 RepID=UPI0037E8B949